MREIEDYYGYFADEDGKIYSSRTRGGYVDKNKLTELKQEITNNGYRRVTFCLNNQTKRLFVHRIMAFTFLEKPDTSKKIVRHLDGDKANNRADNLAWGTHRENEVDKELHGTKRMGENINTSKLKPSDVLKMRYRYSIGHSSKEIHVDFKQVCISSIRNILSGRTWKHI